MEEEMEVEMEVDNDGGGPSRKHITMASRMDGIGREMEVDNDGGGPLRKHMETIVNYVTMTTDISIKLYNEIIDKKRRFIGDENYQNIYKMEVKTGMKEMIKVLQGKEPENCLQILVDVLLELECLKNTGWKEKPDAISALLFELRESISVIERLMESVKEGDVNKVKQLLSQYPIPQDMEHITRECCVLSLERRDLTLVKFLYQKYRSMLHNERTLKRLVTEAVGLDFTEGVQFLFSQGLPPEEKLFYIELLEEAKSVEMLTLLVSEEKIRKSLNDKPWYSSSIFYHQILNSSTQLDCMGRVQILVDAGVRVENLIANRERALLKIIKERWLQVFDYLLDQLMGINYTNRDKQNILHVILVRDKDGDMRNNILDFVRNLVERGIDINSVDKDGETPLMLSCRAGYYDVVKYLIERGADVNKGDHHGWTALMWACRKGHKDIVEYLILHGGADVNKVDKYGWTALMWACKKGYKGISKYLSERGADVNKDNVYGQTALMVARNGGNKDKDIVECLELDGGSDGNKTDNDVRSEQNKIEECKGNISNVNGPEIQQPNQDAIDKEQQRGQDFIGARKSRQTTKGVNMKLEILFTVIKSLVIILVGFPVADCNQLDFKWLPTNKIVKGVYQTDVQLVWKYQNNFMLDKIDINRKKTEDEVNLKKEHVAMWTTDEGSKPNTLLSTDVTLEHRKEDDVGTIILTLIDPYPVDFDKQYYCTVSFEHGVDSMEIELQSYRVEYQPVADVVKARPGDDVQFVWIYKYPLPVTFVDFYKDDDIQNEILTCSRDGVMYDIEDEYKNRATVNITTNKDQEEVTLTLRNVTRGDFDQTYHSSAIPANGYFKSSEITLRRLPELKWLPTDTIVKGVFITDVQLVWKYQSNLMLDKIDINRKKTEYEKEDVALWTPDEGSKPNTLLSTDVTLEHRKEGGVGTIILTLIQAYPVDFDKQYYCTVYFENGLDFMEIELQSYRIEYQPVADAVKARPGDDVQFVWIYKYPLPVNIIEFHNNLNKTETEMAYWYKEWRFIIVDEYRDRLRFDQKQNHGNETEITLTLLNTTIDDFNITYYGNAIAKNGYQSSSRIYLTVEEEKPKPGQETISTPSSASRLSQVSMFLICSVWLLAVMN